MSSTGAFVEPTVFEVLLDRISTDVYPSERYVISAAMSATDVDQLERLLKVVGGQQVGQYLSPRRLQLLGMIGRRRAMLPAAQKVANAVTGRRDEDADPVTRDDLASAIELLEQTSNLLAQP